jgi:elongation factor P--(R)-beta-lysine ligase
MLKLGGSEVLRRLRARNRAEAEVRRYFADQDFVEVHTPTRVAAPGTDVYIDPIPSDGEWLITSPEFHHKRLLANGIPRLFEFARCFRKEELGPFHQPEFTLLEWYRCQESAASVMGDTEALVERVAEALCRGVFRRGEAAVRIHPPFERVRVRDAFREFAGIEDVAGLAEERPDAYFQAWVDSVEPGLAKLERPVFVVEFPLSQAALAERCEHEPRYAERFELFALGLELCNGYRELTDPAEQRRRFEHDNLERLRRGKPELPIDEGLLAALALMPPSSGNALGFERLLALCLGTDLNGVVPFAREP